MKRRALWLLFGTILLVGIGAGYVPDLMLAREADAAQAEGLIGATEREPAIPAKEDARVAYIEVLRQNQAALHRLQNDFMRQSGHPDPGVRRLAAVVAKAAELPRFSPRWTKLENEDSDASFVSSGSPDLELNLMSVALVLAKTTPDERGLRAAARIASHLRDGGDPIGAPFADWANVAERVLDGVTRLRLEGPERKRVFEALRPYPDLKATTHRHVSAVYALLQGKRHGSASMTRAKRRYLGFWRGFLRDAPTDPEAFAKRIDDQEDEIRSAEAGLGLGMLTYASSRASDWSIWANSTAKTLKRLEKVSP